MPHLNQNTLGKLKPGSTKAAKQSLVTAGMPPQTPGDLISLLNWRSSRAQEPAISQVQAMANPDAPARLEPRKNSVLRFLSFNIQVGITTCAYRQYLTRGWKHLLPHEERHENLKKIAKIVSDYDLVALQEVDAGSLRSGYVNQVAYLADKAIFPYWYAQLNRDLGRFAQHGNGLLSRIKPSRLEDHKLPGMLPGRGAITMRFQFSGVEVLVILMHLSLGTRSRHLQLEYVHRLIEDEEHVVLIGDMNSHLQSLLFNSPLESTNLRPAEEVLPTYPSWQPAVALDHVLVTPGLEISEFEVLDCNISDHLPVSVSLSLSSNTDASSPRRGRMQ